MTCGRPTPPRTCLNTVSLASTGLSKRFVEFVEEYALGVATTRERLTDATIAAMRDVFVDYDLVGNATEFPLDLSGRNKPSPFVGLTFLAVGDGVPTYVASIIELLGDGWVMVRLDERLPVELDRFYEPLN